MPQTVESPTVGLTQAALELGEDYYSVRNRVLARELEGAKDEAGHWRISRRSLDLLLIRQEAVKLSGGDAIFTQAPSLSPAALQEATGCTREDAARIAAIWRMAHLAANARLQGGRLLRELLADAAEATQRGETARGAILADVARQLDALHFVVQPDGTVRAALDTSTGTDAA